DQRREVGKWHFGWTTSSSWSTTSRLRRRSSSSSVWRWKAGCSSRGFVDRLVGLENVRCEIVTLRTRDGHGRIELDKFHTPAAVRAEPRNKPVNTLGIRRIMFAVDGLDEVLARCAPMAPSSSAKSLSTRTSTGSTTFAVPRASWSRLPRSSGEAWRWQRAANSDEVEHDRLYLDPHRRHATRMRLSRGLVV